MRRHSIRVLIAECIPSLNKGELAILLGMLRTFQELGDTEVSIFSEDPSLDQQRFPSGLRIIDIRNDLYLGQLGRGGFARNLVAIILSALQHLIFAILHGLFGRYALRVMTKGIWREYCKSDVILICHDQVSCARGFLLTFSPIYITLLAKVLHKPVVIYANGTHNFGRLPWKLLGALVLNMVDLTTVRDAESFLYLERFVLNKNRIQLTGDPAILLPPSSKEEVEDIFHTEGIDRGKPLVGAALSHEVLSNSANGYLRAVAEVASAFDSFIENHDAVIVFVPHCIEKQGLRDDRVVAAHVYQAMKHKRAAHVITTEYSSRQLKGLMAEFELLISTRVHAAIGALSSGVPSIVLTGPCDRRAYGLIGGMLQQSEWIYDVTNLSADGLYKRMASLYRLRGTVRRNLVSAVGDVTSRALLNGKLLRDLLNRQVRVSTISMMDS